MPGHNGQQLIVVAFVQALWYSNRGPEVNGQREGAYVLPEAKTSPIIAAVRDTAEGQPTINLLVVDDKNGDRPIRDEEIPSWLGERFPLSRPPIRESELAKSVTEERSGEICLIDVSGKCTCGGIIHALLGYLEREFPECDQAWFTVPSGCHMGVDFFLREWCDNHESPTGLFSIYLEAPGTSFPSQWWHRPRPTAAPIQSNAGLCACIK